MIRDRHEAERKLPWKGARYAPCLPGHTLKQKNNRAFR